MVPSVFGGSKAVLVSKAPLFFEGFQGLEGPYQPLCLRA